MRTDIHGLPLGSSLERLSVRRRSRESGDGEPPERAEAGCRSERQAEGMTRGANPLYGVKVRSSFDRLRTNGNATRNDVSDNKNRDCFVASLLAMTHSMAHF
ncbi:MAG: hypothetical protein HZA14_12330 [Nitrospirae bacterium]|nr:hypothetical protein [Nitrospirota bacterium]